MKLVIVTPYPPPLSGISHYGHHVSHGLSQFGKFASIVVLANEVESNTVSLASNSLDVRRVWRFDDLTTVLRLVREIRANDPDAVWFNLGMSIWGNGRANNFLGLLTPLLTKKLGYRTIVTLHALVDSVDLRQLHMPAGPLERVGGKLATRALLGADYLCVTTRSNERILRTRYGARNVVWLPLPAYFTPSRPSEPNGHHSVLMFTTHASYKGLDLLLAAFDRLYQEHPETCLNIAGADHPRFKGYLRSMQERYAGHPGINWLGIIADNDFQDTFTNSNVVVLPYQATTGSSSVLHQACALGVPVIASDLAEIRDVVHDEGLRVEFFDHTSEQNLYDILKRIVFDKRLQVEIGRHNWYQMQANSLKNICERYANLIWGHAPCS